MSRPIDIGRFECKYTVPVAQRQRILEVVEGHVVPDAHGDDLPNGGKGYTVHSLYLDTPRLDDLHDRLAEGKVRNRLRARTYGRPGQRQPVFLENKRKLDNWVIKHRVRVCDADAWCARAGDPSPWAHFAGRVTGRGSYAARHFVELVEEHRRRPVSVVHYMREVYQDRRPGMSKVRLTLDYHVSATADPRPVDLYAEPDVELLPPDWMVMELKFNVDRPAWMRRLCKELRLRAVPVSKFGLSVVRTRCADQVHKVRYLTPPAIRQMGWGL